MQVTVRLFAALAEAAGQRSLSLDVESGADAGAVKRMMIERFPGAVGLCKRSAIAVNAEYADEDRPLADGDEVALIPPVSGG